MSGACVGRSIPLVTSAFRQPVNLLSRVLALVTGFALMYGSINVAAEVGDILLAIPMLFIGGLQLLYAITGFYPRRSPFTFWIRRERASVVPVQRAGEAQCGSSP
jgi:hypothetical protein